MVNSDIKKDTARIFVYFSQLMDKTVLDKDGVVVGRAYDIVVKPTVVYPQSAILIIRKGFPNSKYALIKWLDIDQIAADNKEIKLSIDKSKIIFAEKHDNKEELTLRRDILDQQVVDTYNHKVIRVNDIHLLFVDHSLMVAHVDISTRGLLRRLGFEKLIDFLIRRVNKDAPYLKTEYLISWKYIHPLSLNPASMTIKVDAPHKNFSTIPAADLGDIFLDLNINQKISLFKSLDLLTKARVFTHVDFKIQKSLIEKLDNKEIVDILHNIPSDEATDLLEKLPREKTNQLLSLMESKHSKKLSELLGYSSDSAGGLMTTEYIAFQKDTAVEVTLKQIKERTFKVEPAQFVYIIDEQNHLVGSTNFRHLILANPQEPIQKAAFPKTYFVHLDSSVKEVAYLMEKYKYYALPVVDENNILQGIITVDDVLSQVISLAWRRLKRIKILPKQ
jgi:CBS domain-containing protein/sporulation protein YlmC with PRC-barrel domain